MELWSVTLSELYTATREGLSPDLVGKDNQGENLLQLHREIYVR